MLFTIETKEIHSPNLRSPMKRPRETALCWARGVCVKVCCRYHFPKPRPSTHAGLPGECISTRSYLSQDNIHTHFYDQSIYQPKQKPQDRSALLSPLGASTNYTPNSSSFDTS